MAARCGRSSLRPPRRCLEPSSNASRRADQLRMTTWMTPRLLPGLHRPVAVPALMKRIDPIISAFRLRSVSGPPSRKSSSSVHWRWSLATRRCCT